MTKDDLLAAIGSSERGGEILAKGKPRKLGVEVESVAGSTATSR